MPISTYLDDNFFRQFPAGLAVIEASSNVLRPNAHFCMLLGYDEAELQTATLQSLILPEDWEKYSRLKVQNPQTELAKSDREVRFIQKQGGLIWMRISHTTSQDGLSPSVELLAIEDISELKSFQQTLEESEARIKRMVGAASIGLYDWNVQTDESYWNDLNYELLDLPKNDSPPNFKRVLAKLSTEDREIAQTKMRNLIEHGGIYDHIYKLALPDGSYRYVQSLGKVTERDEQGKTQIVSGVLTDVTALKSAQEKADQAQARFKKIVEANLIGIIIFKKDGSILEANQAFLTMLGYSREELEAGLLNWRALTPPEYRSVSDRNQHILESSGIMPISEKQYFHKDGHRVDIILTVALFDDDPETGVGFILDNTLRKEQERAICKNEKNWRTLANCMPQMVWMADTEGNRYWFNQRWFDFTGCSLEEAQGTGWQKLLHPDHRQRVAESLQAAFHAETNWEGSYLILGSDQQYHWFLGRALPMRDERGKVAYWLGTSTNVTELHDAQEALLHSQRQLEASNRDLEQFASIASHDLQAPLRKAKTFCETIYNSARDKLDDNTLDLMRRANDSLSSMQTLVSDLLELSRISKEPERFESVDLNLPLREALTNLSDTLQETNAQIHAGQLGIVHGDPLQLTQLLQNLIQNALKYQPEGQRPVISIQSDCNGQHCQIHIQDNGIGFPEEYAEKIFKPFERLHGKHSTYGGTGIGLAICKRIVERHNGHIKAYGEPDHGAMFTVTLPQNPKVYTEFSTWHAKSKLGSPS